MKQVLATQVIQAADELYDTLLWHGVIGVTGTRQPLLPHQVETLQKLLKINDRIFECHYGGCIGADFDAATICTRLGIDLVLHPPTNTSQTNYVQVSHLRIEPAESYLERNKSIASACTLLIAFPRSEKEELRSGTWATIRYARAAGKQVILIPRSPTPCYTSTSTFISGFSRCPVAGRCSVG